MQASFRLDHQSGLHDFVTRVFSLSRHDSMPTRRADIDGTHDRKATAEQTSLQLQRTLVTLLTNITVQ